MTAHTEQTVHEAVRQAIGNVLEQNVREALEQLDPLLGCSLQGPPYRLSQVLARYRSEGYLGDETWQQVSYSHPDEYAGLCARMRVLLYPLTAPQAVDEEPEQARG